MSKSIALSSEAASFYTRKNDDDFIYDDSPVFSFLALEYVICASHSS